MRRVGWLVATRESDRLAHDLADYQSEHYARRFRDVVERARAVLGQIGAAGSLEIAVASQTYSL